MIGLFYIGSNSSTAWQNDSLMSIDARIHCSSCNKRLWIQCWNLAVFSQRLSFGCFNNVTSSAVSSQRAIRKETVTSRRAKCLVDLEMRKSYFSKSIDFHHRFISFIFSCVFLCPVLLRFVMFLYKFRRVQLNEEVQQVQLLSFDKKVDFDLRTASNTSITGFDKIRSLGSD